MSLINADDQLIDYSKLDFDFGVDLDAVPSVSAGSAKIDFVFGLDLKANPSEQIVFGFAVNLNAVPRVNNEPNIFETVNFDFAINLDASLSIQQRNFINFNFGFDVDAVPSIRTAPDSALRLTVSLLPPAPVANRQQVRARLLADGTELPIKGFSLDAPAASSGMRLQLALVRTSDKAAAKAASGFSFEIGLVNGAGVTDWQSIISGGTLASLSHSIGITLESNPSDQLSISTLSDLTDRLNKAPNNNLIFYDPARADAPQNSDEILRDTLGNYYPDQIFAVQNLSLYKIFQRILLERCGFSGFGTNLPDYAVRSIRAEMTAGLYDSIKPFIGQFDPLVFESANKIWIVDATVSLPAGFPAPRDLEISRYKSLNLDENYDNLDGFVISYSQNDVFDYYTVRTETETESSPQNVLDPAYTKTVTVRTFYDYRNNVNPAVINKSDLVKEVSTTTGSFGDTLGKVSLTRYFDGLGREVKNVKEISNQVPNLPDGSSSSLKVVKTEITETFYRSHPFNIKQQYMYKTVRTVTGLIAVDAENKYLDQNFEQDFTKAHEAGNLTSGMTLRTGAIEKITEKITPVSQSVVSVQTTREDLVRKITTVSKSETRAGDVGLNSQTSRQRQLILLSGTERTGKPLGTLAVGELPLELALPLCKRRLERIRQGKGNFSAEMAGLDLTIQRGSVFNLIERNQASAGAALIEGFRINAENLGTEEQKITTSLQGVRI